MDVNPQAGSATARITAALLGSAGTFMLFAASVVVPPLGFFSGMLAPFPVVFLRLRHGRGTALIVALAAVTALTAIFGVSAGIVYLLQCGAIALLMPELLIKGYGAARTMAWTTACSATLLAVAAGIYSLIGGQNLHQLVSGEVTTSITQAVSLYEKSGVKGDELSMVKQSMEMAAGLIIRIYPALTTILLLAMTGCNLALIRRPAIQMGYDFSIREFREFRLPEPLVWILIVSGFAMLAATPIITTPALNVLVITTMLYFLQGLAVVIAFIARQPFYGITRLFLTLMLLLQPYLAGIVAIIGIFDMWGDFRTPRKKENL